MKSSSTDPLVILRDYAVPDPYRVMGYNVRPVLGCPGGRSLSRNDIVLLNGPGRAFIFESGRFREVPEGYSATVRSANDYRVCGQKWIDSATGKPV